MAKLIPYPETLQFREVVSYVTRYMRYTTDDGRKQMPTLQFIGTVKLHGCNTAVGYQRDIGHWYQSRNRILTLSDDHFGFAEHMNPIGETFLTEHILSHHPVIREHYEQGNTVIVYGEWCGNNIQGEAKIAIRQIRKMFVIFKVKIIDHSSISNRSSMNSEDKYKYRRHGFWLPPHDWNSIKWHEQSVYNIFDFPTYSIDIDFNAPELSQETLTEITNKIEKQCPVGNYFNQNGCGEGIVWIEWDQTHGDLTFKVKGREYSVINSPSLVSISPPKFNNIQEFIEYACTKNRMQQAFNAVLEELQFTIDTKDFNTFLRWLVEDIIKEEKDTMNIAHIDAKDIPRGITSKAEAWFKQQLKEYRKRFRNK
ncbi:unnamed protein product [Adineta ricciae]|uniref:RNA ligase domain-containing protein n=1 Tax=Adineta ricciae TaxID=249248 RepID=A0A815HHH0_ADIRI|nr:unnamed protein product [Adineta ricciae]